MSKEIKVTWKYLLNNEYEGNLGEYTILLYSGKPNRWFIIKDKKVAASCYTYPPMNESGNGKVQSEKALIELITKPQSNETE